MNQFCPQCGYRIGAASWCLQCGWRDETKPTVLRRLDTYILVMVTSVMLAALGVVAAMGNR